MATQSPLLVSVVRDVAMYGRCIAANRYCDGCERQMIDNRGTSIGIPKRYNQLLEDLDYGAPRWLVLCHEDFQPLEDLAKALERADVRRIYGPIGGRLGRRYRWLLGGVWTGVCLGCIETSNKDGTRMRTFGKPVPVDTEVDTLDCQCLIVHSSMIEKYRLRFDERLTFDLYAEDFCLNARLRQGIKTAILPLRCHHYSYGNLQPRFFGQKAYLDKKYPTAEAFGCVGYTIGQGRTRMRRLQKRFRAFLDRHAPWSVNLVFKLASSRNRCRVSEAQSVE